MAELSNSNIELPLLIGGKTGLHVPACLKIGGDVSTVRQYLQAGLIDSLQFALSPVALGQGEALLSGIDLPALGFSVTEHEATEHATHVVLTTR